jgi:uncharacterized protein DUF5667
MKSENNKLNSDSEIMKNLKEITLLDPTLEFQQNSKIRLLSSLPEKTVQQKTFKQSFLAKNFIWKAAATAVIVVLLSAGSCYASQDSLPGEIFYPVKKIIEEVSFNLTINAKIKLHLKSGSARTRLLEAEKLLTGNKNPELIYQTLLDYHQTMLVIDQMLVADSMDNFNTKLLADLENAYYQVINKTPVEVKTKLQSQLREQEKQDQTQEQKQFNQQLENKIEAGFGNDNSNLNIYQQSQKKSENNTNKEVDEIPVEVNKTGQSQINKP